VSEQHRLAEVRRYEILDTPPDGAFDRITALLARLLAVPVAIVSIVDHDRLWFKSRHGLDVEEIPREPGLCASCIMQDGPWVVSDARNDPRALANPLVAGEFGAQFYLGIPLRTRDGFNLGTLCAIDFKPRAATEADIATLTDLAALVMDGLELRLSAGNAIASYHDELARRELREVHIISLMRELAHRTKNLLAVVEAIARQTTSHTTSVGDYIERLAARVHALAHTHDLIADEDWHGVTMANLANRQLEPMVGQTGRLILVGPRVVLTPLAAQNIGLALHELATNALKYGALSVPDGRVWFTWNLGKGDRPLLWMLWREENGPRVAMPARAGFGTSVLRHIAPLAMDGAAQLSFDTSGVLYRLEVPAAQTLPESPERPAQV
jgi:two-component sensor histidine kinase